MQPSSELETILKQQSERIKCSFTGGDPILPLIEIIRSLDNAAYLAHHKIYDQMPSDVWERISFGWSLPFKLFRSKSSDFNQIPVFKFSHSDIQWISQIIHFSGALEICRQLIDFEHAKLGTFRKESPQEFSFRYSVDHVGIEYYDKLALAYYHQIMDEMLQEKSKPILAQIPRKREELKGIVQELNNDFIAYKATDELDAFYSKLGYFFLMTTQVVDEFDESDEFGGLPYKEYLDFVEDTIGSALMHRDCCMALALKNNHKTALRNTLSYCFSKKAFLEVLGTTRLLSEDKARQILSCLTLNDENIDYLIVPGMKPPPFFSFGTDGMVRSDYGSLYNSIYFLNRELKRRFPNDYFKAVNNREKRFRKLIYGLFPDERIMKIEKQLLIKEKSFHTDIDAALYDKERGILGLFQLKWQDIFGASMKERYSRISNLVPKSVEWIDKIQGWLSNTCKKEISDLLGIAENDEINDVYLFIVAKNHINFTDVEMDKRAAWTSWYHIVEASAKVKDPFRTNPIGEFAAKLDFFAAEHRKKRDPLPNLSEQELRFAGTKVKVVCRT